MLDTRYFEYIEKGKVKVFKSIKEAQKHFGN